MRNIKVFKDRHGKAVIDSESVADALGKSHRSVVNHLEIIANPKFGFGKKFCRANFERSVYTDCYGNRHVRYFIRRDGFVALFRLYTGRKAEAVRKAFVRRIIEIEDMDRR